MESYALNVNYLANCIMCMILTASLGFQMDRDVGHFREIRNFKYLTTFTILVTASEAIWSLDAHTACRFPFWLLWILTIIEFCATSAVTYFLYRFVRDNLAKADILSEKKAERWLGRLPFVAVQLMHFTSPWLKMTFWYDESGHYIRGAWYMLHVVLTMGYLFVSIGLLVWALLRTERRRHGQIHALLIFTMFPTVGGILQVAVGEAPITSMSVTGGIIYLFIRMQKSHITTDALTGLTNRRRMSQVIAGKIRNADSTPFYLFMGDIDGFKSINDHFGHLEGDRALVIIADAMRNLGREHPSMFISRYGGDEFLFTINQEPEFPPVFLVAGINGELTRLCKEANRPYSLSMSIGYQLVTKKDENMAALIESADKKLYACKARRKR